MDGLRPFRFDQSGTDQDFIKVEPKEQPENKGKAKGSNKDGNSTSKIGSYTNLCQAIEQVVLKEEFSSGYKIISSTHRSLSRRC